MKYPEYALIDNKKIKINTDYRVALACLKAINDEEITDVERGFAVISLLFGEDTEIQDMEEALKKASYYLYCGIKNKSNMNEEIVMDFDQDEEYIRTSIRTDFGINLNEIEYMHWWEYNELIHGLTEQCILSKIIGIRQMDESDYKDPKTLRKIRDAKRKVELKKKKIHYNDDEKKLLEQLGIHLREEV